MRVDLKIKYKFIKQNNGHQNNRNKGFLLRWKAIEEHVEISEYIFACDTCFVPIRYSQLVLYTKKQK